MSSGKKTTHGAVQIKAPVQPKLKGDAVGSVSPKSMQPSKPAPRGKGK